MHRSNNNNVIENAFDWLKKFDQSNDVIQINLKLDLFCLWNRVLVTVAYLDFSLNSSALTIDDICCLIVVNLDKNDDREYNCGNYADEQKNT